jgi:uncharacterized protein
MNVSVPWKRVDPQLVVFFGLAYVIAWPIAFVFGVDESAIQADYGRVVAALIIHVPKFAFSISGLLLFAYTRKLRKVGAFLSRWRVKWYWYTVAYFGPAALYLVSAFVTISMSSLTPIEVQFELPATILALLVGPQTGILVYFLFRGGLGEEIGLRGFALERLQQRHSPVKSGLVIGFWWGFWHLPAWTGRPVLEVVVVWLGVISFSLIFTWIYNRTQSLPVVMLLHAALNSFDDVLEFIFPQLARIDWELPYIGAVLILGAVSAIALVRRGRRVPVSEGQGVT